MGLPPLPARQFKPRNTQRARDLRNAPTPAEALMWRALQRSQLGAKFSRQIQIGPFFADFVCRRHKLVIEVDGFSHDVDRRRDARRDAYLREVGFRVVHFTNDDVLGNLEGVVIVIRQSLGGAPTP